jgi:hypothetical protein
MKNFFKLLPVLLMAIFLFLGTFSLIEMVCPSIYWKDVCGNVCDSVGQNKISQVFIAHRDSSQRMFLFLAVVVFLASLLFLRKKNKMSYAVLVIFSLFLFIYSFFDRLWLVSFGGHISLVYLFLILLFSLGAQLFLYKKFIK